MPKIIVVANCQARAVADILRVALQGRFEIDTIISHLATAADEEAHAQLLSDADCIFAQVTTDEYPTVHVRSNVIRSKYSAHITVWPNAFFAGQCPNLCYITAQAGARVQGPLGPYHDRRIYQFWSDGAAIADCLKELQCTPDVDIRIPAQVALQSLRQREQSSDIIVSDLLEEHWKRRRLFFTFNHPTSFLLIEIARRLGMRIGEDGDIDIYPEIFGEPLGTVIPLFSTVREFADGRISAIGEFSRGMAIASMNGGQIAHGKARIYSLEQLVDAAYRAFDAQNIDRSKVRFTPVLDVGSQDE